MHFYYCYCVLCIMYHYHYVLLLFIIIVIIIIVIITIIIIIIHMININIVIEMLVSCPPVVALAKLIQEVSDLSWFAHAFFNFVCLLSLYSGLQPCIPHRNLNHFTLRLNPLYTPPQPTVQPTSTHSTPHLHPILSSMLPSQQPLRVRSLR